MAPNKCSESKSRAFLSIASLLSSTVCFAFVCMRDYYYCLLLRERESLVRGGRSATPQCSIPGQDSWLRKCAIWCHLVPSGAVWCRLTPRKNTGFSDDSHICNNFQYFSIFRYESRLTLHTQRRQKCLMLLARGYSAITSCFLLACCAYVYRHPNLVSLFHSLYKKE